MPAPSAHPLRSLLDAAANGRFPPVDGVVEVMSPDRAGRAAIVEFTGHAVVVTDRLSSADLAALGADGFGGVTQPEVVRAVAGAGGRVGSLDAVLVARGTGADETGRALARRDDLDDHPRVVRSRHHRTEVAVHGDDHGLVTLGRGLVGRRELSVETFAGAPAGAGRRLISAGLDLVSAGEVVWAQVAPGNAASLRAFLHCGFVPVGAEILLETRP